MNFKIKRVRVRRTWMGHPRASYSAFPKLVELKLDSTYEDTPVTSSFLI